MSLLFLLGSSAGGAQALPTAPLAAPSAPSDLLAGGFPGGQIRLAWLAPQLCCASPLAAHSRLWPYHRSLRPGGPRPV